MTREEFESILEEAFLEGYNNAYEEIEEILDEDYIDIEDDYEVYDEALTPENKAKIRDFVKTYKDAGGTKKGTSLATRGLVARLSTRGQRDGAWEQKRPFTDEEMERKGYKKIGNNEFKHPNDKDGVTSSRITSISNKVAEKYGRRIMDRAMKKKKDMNALMHTVGKMQNKYGDLD